MRKRKLLWGIAMILLVSFTLFGCTRLEQTVKQNNYSVSGAVIDEEGNGIADVTIRFEGQEDFGVAVTDDTGKWTKTNLTGEVVVSAIQEGGSFGPYNITVTGNEKEVIFTKYDVNIANKTRVFGRGGVDAKLISVSEDALIFEQMTTGLKALQPDDVVVFGVTELTPKGLLRKVQKVSQEGNQVVVSTTSATLEEAISEGKLDFNRAFQIRNVKKSVNAVDGVNLTASDSGNFEFKVEFKDVALYDADGSTNTSYDQIKVSGAIQFNYSMDLTGSISGAKIQTLRFTNTLEQQENLEVTIGTSVGDFLPDGWKYEKTLKTIYLNPITFWIGGVPVVITPNLKINVGIEGDVYAQASSSIVRTETITSGVGYSYGNWYPIGSIDHDVEFTWPTLSAGIKAKAYAGPELECDLYGVAGPFGRIQGYLEFESDVFSSPSWKLYGGLEAIAGFELEIMSNTIGSASYKAIDFKEVLVQAGTTSLTVAHPDPLVVGSTANFSGEVPYGTYKVIASVDGYALTDEKSGSKNIYVYNGKYDFDYTFSSPGKDRRLVINAFDRNGNSLEQTSKYIDVYEKGHLDVNYLISNRTMELTGKALAPIYKVIISVDGYTLTDAYGNSNIYVYNGEFNFDYTFGSTGDNRRLVVNAFDRNGNSVNQIVRYIDVK